MVLPQPSSTTFEFSDGSIDVSVLWLEGIKEFIAVVFVVFLELVSSVGDLLQFLHYEMVDHRSVSWMRWLNHHLLHDFTAVHFDVPMQTSHNF